MIQLESSDSRKRLQPSWCAILGGDDFREEYHRALNRADRTFIAQRTAAHKVVQKYFHLELVASNVSLNRDVLYFTHKRIKVKGVFKFLMLGTVKRNLIDAPLFALKLKTTGRPSTIETKEFEHAIASVEAVRLTLTPERLNGILSFLLDAKHSCVSGDYRAAENAIGTAQDHLNRAAVEGLRRFSTGAERGRRGNEIIGTQRVLAELRNHVHSQGCEQMCADTVTGRR